MKSSVKTGLTIGAVVIAIILVGTYFMMSFSVQSTAIDLQEGVNAEITSVESKHSTMNNIIRDLVKGTKAEQEAFLKFHETVAESKKGQTIGGMMTAIQEVYPDFDIDGYKKVYNEIVAQRQEFHTQQKIYNERVRAYNSYRRKPMGKFFLDAEEFPKVEQFVISSSNTKKAMETGIDDSEAPF